MAIGDAFRSCIQNQTVLTSCAVSMESALRTARNAILSVIAFSTHMAILRQSETEEFAVLADWAVELSSEFWRLNVFIELLEILELVI